MSDATVLSSPTSPFPSVACQDRFFDMGPGPDYHQLAWVDAKDEAAHDKVMPQCLARPHLLPLCPRLISSSSTQAVVPFSAQGLTTYLVVEERGWCQMGREGKRKGVKHARTIMRYLGRQYGLIGGWGGRRGDRREGARGEMLQRGDGRGGKEGGREGGREGGKGGSHGKRYLTGRNVKEMEAVDLLLDELQVRVGRLGPQASFQPLTRPSLAPSFPPFLVPSLPLFFPQDFTLALHRLVHSPSYAREKERFFTTALASRLGGFEDWLLNEKKTHKKSSPTGREGGREGGKEGRREGGPSVHISTPFAPQAACGWWEDA